MKEAVVLVPCYNPDELIMDKFINKLNKSFKNIVIVNDGCSKEHEDYINKLSKNFDIYNHKTNLGKGMAIKNGINYISKKYPKALSIVVADCDGQHSVEDIKRVSECSLKYPDDLILGVRDFDSKNVPIRSRLGNVLTRNIMYNVVGEKISDTQTGLRAMGINLAKKLTKVRGNRFEYETNVLITCKRKNILIKEVAIDTIYINDNKTSHFNPLKDSIRVYKNFSSYLLVILLAWLLENYLFNGTYNFTSEMWSIPVFLLLSKSISSLIVSLCNKHINLMYVVVNYLLTVIIFNFIKKKIMLIKILIDIIMAILLIIFTRFKTIKEDI